MDDDPEFPLQTTGRTEVIEKYYFDQESELMPAPNFFQQPEAPELRSNAIRTITQYSEGRNLNIFIPYLAVNYFDRFVSRNPLPNIEGDKKTKQLVTSICCLTIAAKMVDSNFRARRFLEDVNLNITVKTMAKGELSILKGLRWRMCSVTPFSFVEYYHPLYEALGGFRRRSINTIIIESQKDIYFTRFKPSEIASSSLMAAASLRYPKEFLTYFVHEVERAPGLCELIHLCIDKRIKVEGAPARTFATSSTQEAGEASEEAIPRRPGKEEASTSQIHPVSAEDNKAVRRRPGKEVEASSEIHPLQEDEQAVRRRPDKEVAASLEIHPLEEDEQAVRRRPGKEVAASLEIHPLEEDEQAVRRRPGKEVAASLEIHPLEDEAVVRRRPGKEMAASLEIHPVEDEVVVRRRRSKVVAASLEIHPVEDEAAVRRRTGKEEESTSSEIGEVDARALLTAALEAAAKAADEDEAIVTLRKLFEESRRIRQSRTATLEIERVPSAIEASAEDTITQPTVTNRLNPCCDIL